MLDLKEQALEFVFSSNLSWNPGLLVVERQPLIYFCKGISEARGKRRRQEEARGGDQRGSSHCRKSCGRPTNERFLSKLSFQKGVSCWGHTWLNGSVARKKSLAGYVKCKMNIPRDRYS